MASKPLNTDNPTQRSGAMRRSPPGEKQTPTAASSSSTSSRGKAKPTSLEDDDEGSELVQARQIIAERQLQAAQFEAMRQELEELKARPIPSVERAAHFNDELTPLPHTFRGTRENSSSSANSGFRRIERIPYLAEKLSDGRIYRAKQWESRILDNLEDYGDFFISDRQKKNYVLDQTEGIARDYLAPKIADRSSDASPEDLVHDVVTFLSDPAEQQQGEIDFEALHMLPKETFWEFYLEFCRLASIAEITDQRRLRNAMRGKVLSRLRKPLNQKWAETSTFDEWVTAIQNEDTGYRAETTLYASFPIPTPRSREPPAKPTRSSEPRRQYDAPPQPRVQWADTRNPAPSSGPSAFRQQSYGPNTGTRASTPGGTGGNSGNRSPTGGSYSQRSSSAMPPRFENNTPRNFAPNRVSEVEPDLNAEESRDDDPQGEYYDAVDQQPADQADLETTSRGNANV